MTWIIERKVVVTHNVIFVHFGLIIYCNFFHKNIFSNVDLKINIKYAIFIVTVLIKKRVIFCTIVFFSPSIK
jgi:hypothetical protein